MEHDMLLIWAIRGLTQKCLDLLVQSPDAVNSAKTHLRAKRLQEHLYLLDDLVQEATAHGVKPIELPSSTQRLLAHITND